MNVNSINLGVRFLLECTSLITLGVWAYVQGEGLLKWVLALAVPILSAVIWGVFAVPDDPSRSGNAPIPVSGLMRLLLELAFFASAVWALTALQPPLFAYLFGIVVLLHYLVAYQRLAWLLRQ
ncbi:MAG: YrdB family protein [Pseudohongiella sp.]|nr:YrdB family protein [Pseudohongiella sp.]